MSYTPKQPGSGAGGSGSGQSNQQKTLAQQMQDVVNANALTQAISSSQAFSNLNMSRQQQQQQQQQRFDLLMKQQQFIFSNPQIQQLQQQIQQHIQQQQNASLEPLALTRGPNQQQQANGSAGASMLANQQLQLQQAYANPANLMQQLQAYQYQMQQQQQQQQQHKMIPMNQAQQSLTSATFQAQNAAAQAFQQQQKLLAAAAAAQNKSMAATTKSSMQINQPNVNQQMPSNNNLPNKSPARMAGSTQNFPKIPASIQPATGKPPQVNQTAPMMKQTTSTVPSAPKSSSITVSGNVTITKSSPSPIKTAPPAAVPLTKSTSNVPATTITKMTVSTAGSQSQSSSKSLTVNSPQSQSPKPAVAATSTSASTPVASTIVDSKPQETKEATPQVESKSEKSPLAAKSAALPKEPAANPEPISSVEPLTPVSSQDEKEEKKESSLSTQTPAAVPAPTPPLPAPANVPEETPLSEPIEKSTDISKSEDSPQTESDTKTHEQESQKEETSSVSSDTKIEETLKSDAAPLNEFSNSNGSPKSLEKTKPIAPKKSTSPPKQDPVTKSTDIGKTSEKKKSPANTSSSAETVKALDTSNRPPVVASPSTPAAPTKTDNAETPKTIDERRGRRHRLKTIPFQSPLPELAYITKLSVAETSASSSPKATEEKLVLFYKNEYLAVRNAEGSFFLCQTLQNVFRTSPKIRIRWLSEKKDDEDVYIPDFYDNTDIECVLTTVEMEKVTKDNWRIPKAEKNRIQNILKKAIDVEKGVAPKPVVTEENPDGLDISLYKNESQIEKRKQMKPQKEERKSSRTPAKRTSTTSQSKSPKKKRKTNVRNNRSESDESEETDNDKEYKPKKSGIVTQLKVARAQRSPLAKARAASPIILKNNDSTPKARNATVPNKNSLDKKENVQQATPTSSISRSDRAKRRGEQDNSNQGSPPKKPTITSTVSRRISTKSPGNEKAAKTSDDELLVPLPEKSQQSKNTVKTPNAASKKTQKPTTDSGQSESDSVSNTTVRLAAGRATRVRK